MDQLFVNERLHSPSPSPSSSMHDDGGEGGQQGGGGSARQGKQPEDRQGQVLHGENRERRSSRSTLGEGAGRRSSKASTYNGEGDGNASVHVGHASGSRRPTLSNRSTEERLQASRNAVADQGLFWDGAEPSRQRHNSVVDLYTSEDGAEIYRTASRRSPERVSESGGPAIPRRYSRASRPYSYAGGFDHGDIPIHRSSIRSSGLSPAQIMGRESPSAEVVVPRWQPDAEVTFCPICKTQFSFFVRKHHCRKCGRVVCNACSPHRITIPHQYIVQPPTDTSTDSRPPADAARARSSTVVHSLGGGERVRLCNPCVPDPNIAPPQTRSDGQPISGHSRSQSTVPFSPTRRGDLDIPTYRTRDGDQDSGIDAQSARDRYWASNPHSTVRQPTSSSYGPRSDSLARPDTLEARSRSSTVGSSRGAPQNNSSYTQQEGTSSYIRQYHAVSPHSQANLSRPLPNTPQTHRQHRRIREEDQCWLCFRELPSRDLPNSEELRSAHVMACLESATLRASGSPVRSSASTPAPPPPPQPAALPSQPLQPPQRQILNATVPLTPAATSSSHTTRPAPPANSTPESRMLARERQHAAIVLGQSSASAGPSSATAMSRVIPYIASEKDGIDDAECMICMEEFEVGQEMGRLECFCRFHLACIKGWFERKAGKCPVHGGDFF